MFKAGDNVRNVKADIVGVVVEVDGTRVYIEQANGSEVDFDAAALVLEADYQAKHDKSAKADGAGAKDLKIYQNVIGNLYPAILQMGQLLHSRAKPVPGVTPKRWEELSPLQQLNVLSEATDTPVKAWLDANEPSAKPNLGALQLSVLAARKK